MNTNTDILFRVGITTCELCDKPATQRDPDLGWLLCDHCHGFLNVTNVTDDELDSYGFGE